MRKVYSLLLLVLLFGAGFFIGRETTPASVYVTDVSGMTPPDEISVDFEPFWEVWQLIDERFVTSEDSANTQDKVWGAISGLAQSLGDPYTEFLVPEDTEMFEEELSGVFGGVGMEIDLRDDLITVVSPLHGTPAEAAGLIPGDAVIAIDGESALDLSVYEAVEKIRGEIGTTVTLTLLRDDVPQPFDVSIVRDVIAVPTIDTELRSDGIFVLRLFNFGATSPQLFEEGITEFIASGSDKLILDLRGNPGGFLEAAIDIASWFLPSGTTVVAERYDSSEDNGEVLHRSRGYNVFSDDTEIIVLIDRGSASASEIVAGALREYEVAQLVGTQTFGKGSVQELIDISGDAALKLTVARWYTPLGHSISDGGLAPDIEVELTLDDIQTGNDIQFEKAIELLGGDVRTQ